MLLEVLYQGEMYCWKEFILTLKVLLPGLQCLLEKEIGTTILTISQNFSHDRNEAQQKDVKLGKAGERRGEERKRKVKSREHLEILQSVRARTLEADIILFMSNRKLQYLTQQNILLHHLRSYIDLNVNWKENCCFTAVACFLLWGFILNTLSKFINIQYVLNNVNTQ